MKVEMRNIETLKPYPGNPRKNEMAVDAVAKSIKAFGFKVPIVIDKDSVIIAGHTRLFAAQKLGLSDVPCVIASDLTPAQAKAFRIADNQTATIAAWDFPMLQGELTELAAMDIDLEGLGFNPAELDKILGADFFGNAGLQDPDYVPEPPDKAITQEGDLWLLGDHRLLCGDSSKTEDVDRLLDGAKIQLVNTDPPYNVQVAPRSNNAAVTAAASGEYLGQQGMDAAIRKGGAHATTKKMRPKDRPLVNDFVSDEQFEKMLRLWFGNVQRVLEPGRSYYIWGGYSNIWNYPNALRACELYFSQMIIWVKEHPVLTRKDFMGNHEWCFYGWREGAAHYFTPEIHNATDVWIVKKVNQQNMIHLTEKPVELAVRAMTYSSRPGENVLDLFGGSGSTLIAAEKTGRKAFLMEIDALYCDVIADRYQRFSGKPAILERTGTSPIPMKPREEAKR
jgi:DNA modification methylase